MHWWLFAIIFGLPLALFAFAFIVGCFEKHPVRMFAPAPPPPDVSNYVSAMIHRAGALGFSWLGHGEHTKYGQKLTAELMLSGDRYVLALVASGRIAGLPSKKSILFSRFGDGGVLMTVDEAGTAELDVMTERQIIMNADFEELVRKHYEVLMRDSGRAAPFPADANWGSVDALYRERVDRIVARGLGRYADAQHEFFRYTPVGSFRATFVHGLLQVLRPSNYWRTYKPRPG